MLEGLTVKKLHCDERLLMLVVNFVDGADVRMVQCGGCLGFALKPAERLRVFGDVVGQELKGDKAVELDILSLIDHTHPAAAEFLNDAVVRDGSPDHQGQILRGGNGQVNESRGVGTVAK